MKLHVQRLPKEHSFGEAYGITNGKLWFAYAYADKAQADRVLERMMLHPDKLAANVNREAPLEMARFPVRG